MFWLTRSILRCALAITLVAAGVSATMADPAVLLRKMLSDAPLSNYWAQDFAPAFRSAISQEQLAAILTDLRAAIGPATAITLRGDKADITTKTHRLMARIALDSKGRVAMLFFEPPQETGQTLAQIENGLRRLGDNVSWLARSGSEDLSEQHAHRALSVASAFKLAVLAELDADIKAGQRTWADTFTLRTDHQSLPSGRLHLWPEGAVLTLHTLAALMISESDNTATDMLIDLLGHERIAARLGLPHLLSTRAFFALKADQRAREAYLATEDPVEKAGIADNANRVLPDVSQVLSPHDPNVGWSVSARQICKLLDAVKHLPLMAINPGPLDAGDWSELAYKGGSELGVLNLSARVTNAEGRTFCVVLTINHSLAVDEDLAVSSFRKLVHYVNSKR